MFQPMIRTKLVRYEHNPLDFNPKSKESIGTVVGRYIDERMHHPQGDGSQITQITVVLQSDE